MQAYSYMWFLIVSFCTISISSCANYVITFDSSTYDTYLPNVQFIQNTAYSFQQCMDICNRFTYCKSVNFHKGTKMCTLNYKAADPPGTIQPRYFTVPQAGYRYMEKASFPTIFVKEECREHSCDRESLCVGSTSCSKWLYNDCGMVDIDLYATTEYPVNGDFDTAIHTCLRAPKGETTGETTRTCNKKTGQWSAPAVPCPTHCLSPPKVREEQVVKYTYSSTNPNLVIALYSCSSYTDTRVTSSCLRSQCSSAENWGWYRPVQLSCHPYDCWRSGTYYRGGVSCTVSGRTCQRWDTNIPHYRNVIPAERNHNFCRQDQHTGPWCYTTDPNVRWEDCYVQKC